MRIASLGKKLAFITQALVLAFGFGAFSVAATAVTSSGTALAANSCAGGPGSANPVAAGAACAQATKTPTNLFAAGGVFQTVADTLIFLVGAVAVIFLIIGGLRYVISNGDSKAVEAAKNTILYAIIGIVVAIISFALVSFVITSIQKAG